MKFAKRSTRFRHGDRMQFQVWISNQSGQAVAIRGGKYRPAVQENSVNLTARPNYLLLGQPSNIVLKAGAEEVLTEVWETISSSSDAAKIDDSSNPLRLVPGAYPMFAELDVSYISNASPGETKKVQLRSPTTQIQVRPAAHLQVQSLYKPAKPRRGGEPRKVTINKDNGPGEICTAYLDYESAIDEDDVLTVKTRGDNSEPQSFSIFLTLHPEVAKRISDGGKRSDGPLTGSRYGHAVFFKDQLISTLMLRAPFGDNSMLIASGLTQERAEKIANQIRKVAVPAEKQQGSKLPLPRTGHRR